MNNLGWYKIIVQASKKVGNPQNLIALLMAAGAGIGIGASYGAQCINKRCKKSDISKEAAILTVKNDITEKDNIFLKQGDRIKIIEIIKGGALIEKLEDPHSPYVITNFTLEQAME